ncbi:LacI family transcriptional regulator [Domibacillus sp. PGB-M46]|uniref:LacI family DNA-binding transcriptional regulator n=1 Tax=Domibacillus sp. PGB-M46 TaxID=2910255 RepID=UPI001F598426|nr:LacI family DNA-binding transcriptional regulator [Domibacillus sp. PGB-M46]MCI2253673.1 LacI family transcriptional regulator [Domibacillus sp. PGB-M46]
MAITIKDIAKAAGVSYSTVSKALNDSPLVQPKTKEKIHRVAREMGYEPNFAAKQLVTNQSKTIGLIWPTLDRAAHSTLVTELNNEIQRRGFSMILSVNPVQASLDLFKRFHVDGVLIFDEENNLSSGVTAPFPVVSYGAGPQNSFSFVDLHYQEAMFQAVKYLKELGHRDISFIGDFSPLNLRQQEKYRGFERAMQHFNLPVHKQSFINSAGLEWYDGYQATKRMLRSSFLPSAVIGASYDISAGIVRAIRETSLVIPKDMSIIGYDNIPQMATLEVPLTSIGVPVQAVAEQMTSLLFEQLETRSTEQLTRTMNSVLIERHSCARVNGR